MAPREKIKIGMKYGSLTVIEEHGRTKAGARKWLCQCECGELCDRDKQYLLDTKSATCPTCSLYGKKRPVIGSTYWNLKAIRPSEEPGKWLFRCERCGNTKEITYRHVIRGDIRSCGCLLYKNKSVEEEEPKKQAVKPYRIGDEFEYMTMREIDASRRVSRMGDINTDAVEAQKLGMTYGKYRAMKILDDMKRKKAEYE